MPNPKSNSFADRLRAVPHFDYARELIELIARQGETPLLVQAVIDEKMLRKEDACR